jgi:predicted homoserine dehydrogenase-like protein
MELYRRLLARSQPIRVGLVGCGQMGSGMVHVTRKIAGMETYAIADIDPSRATAELEKLGIQSDDIVVTNQRGAAEDALRHNKYLVTEDAILMTQLQNLDILVEATGNTTIGAEVAWNCILNQKHIVMLNVETDVTVGVFLSRMAQKAGVIYTVAAGDEPAVCKMLDDFSRCIGFEVVCLGKGKNNVIDYDATPDSCLQEALSKGMNPKMLAAFKDGTKTMVEMAAVSNATGLVPDLPGMHGPQAQLDELSRVFVPQADGGILSKKGCVDYSTGPIAPGVFAIVTTDDERIHADMRFVSMGPGPYYLFLRPFHLCNIETPLAIAEAMEYGEVTVTPKTMVSEVVALAKRDLMPGETIGSIGSADYFNRIYTYTEARQNKAIPMGIAPGACIVSPVRKGEMLTEDNTRPDSRSFVYKLRQMQDDLLNRAGTS